MRRYQQLHASVHNPHAAGPHKVHFCGDDSYVMLAYVAQEFQLYAVFDPLTENALAANLCKRLCSWLKGEEAQLFLTPPSSYWW